MKVFLRPCRAWEGRDRALRGQRPSGVEGATRTLAKHSFWHASSVAHTLRWATLTAQRAVPTT